MTIRLFAAAAAAAAVAFFALDVPAPAGAADVSIRIDRSRISTRLGHSFVFRTTLTNDGAAAAEGLIAHLNVLSYDRSVYVDPEDWSSHRTAYLPRIAPGRSETTTWKMQAVNTGSFAVYVAAVPRLGSPGAPAIGPAIRVEVAKRTTLDARGVLPLALGLPACLGLCSLAVGVSRRRR